MPRSSTGATSSTRADTSQPPTHARAHTPHNRVPDTHAVNSSNVHTATSKVPRLCEIQAEAHCAGERITGPTYYVHAIVTTDSAGEGGGGVGLAEHDAASLDDVGALPHHADHGARGHVGDEAGEEGFGGEVGCAKNPGRQTSVRVNTNVRDSKPRGTSP